jgi:hypothetical protein
MNRIEWIVLASAASSLPAWAEESVRLAPTPIELPARLGPLRIDGEPHRFDPPALGISYQFSGEGSSLTVYVYDAGRSDIPDGGDTTPACQEFEESKSGVERAGYVDTRLMTEQLVRLGEGAGTPLVREAVYEFARDGEATISYIWVTAVARNFVKLRFSLDASLRDEVPEARRAVLTALGSAIAPHLAPVAADAAKPGVAMNIPMGANVEEMATGILYLGVLSAALDEAPDLGPKCGGEFEPPYETELSALRAVLTFDGGESRSGKLLAKAEAAGFLEELVWFELHRDAWGARPPADLDSAGYQAWRKKNLKRFRRPDYGQVFVERPQAMPVAPL